MQVRLEPDVLTTLKTVAEAQHTSVSKIICESIGKVVKGEMNLSAAGKKQMLATSIYIDPDLRKEFEKVVGEQGLKVDRAIRLIAESIISNTQH